MSLKVRIKKIEDKKGMNIVHKPMRILYESENPDGSRYFYDSETGQVVGDDDPSEDFLTVRIVTHK